MFGGKICSLCRTNRIRKSLSFIRNSATLFRQISTTSKNFVQENRPDSEEGSSVTDKPSVNEPKLWEDPYRYAYGPPRPTPKFTEVTESSEEWKWVEKLFPKTTVPPIPNHQKYPTPSGWVPPKYPPPDLPYYVRRNPRHTFSLFLEVRRDQLDPTTMEFNYLELVVMKGVQGDVFRGCANCGFSFCSKCLSRVKVPVPRQGNALYPVCSKCFHTLTAKIQQPEHHQQVPADPAPSTHKEDLLPPSMRQHYPVGATKVPVGHVDGGPRHEGDLLPPSIRQHYPTGATKIEVKPGSVKGDPRQEGDLLPPSMRQHYPVGATKVHLGAETGPKDKKDEKHGGVDENLHSRLGKLKADRKADEGTIPSQTDIENRLANLKGVDPALVKQPRKFFYEEPDRRSQSEKQRDLIGQTKAEVELDAKIPPPEVEIAERLAKLRGQQPTQQQEQPEESKQDNLKNSGQNMSSGTDSTSGVNTSSFLSEEREGEGETVDEINELLMKAEDEARKDAELALEGFQKDKQLQDQLKKLTAEMRQETLKDDKIQAVLGRRNRETEEDDSALEDEEDTEDRNTENIINKIIEEAELEERLSESSNQPKEPESAPERTKTDPKSEKSSMADSLRKRFSWKKPKTLPQEAPAPALAPPAKGGQEEGLPWCSVCTDDAAVRCVGCHGELYCRKCFRQAHTSEDFKTHKWVPYKKTSKETTV